MRVLFLPFISANLFVFASASPLMGARQTQEPWQITDFFGSKVHNSANCQYSFSVSAPSLSRPAKCDASVDAGFSGATWLGFVAPGAGKCDIDTVSWTFYDPTSGGDAKFNVTINGVVGLHTVAESDITVNLNNEPNPFDNDVYYSGPQNFSIDSFTQG